MKRQQFIRLLLSFGAGSVGGQFLKGCQQSPSRGTSGLPIELSFGILTTESEADLLPNWQPFLEDLAEAIGYPVRPFFADQYSSLIEAMRSGAIQMAWFGGKVYVEAATVADARAFALTVSDEGSRGYYAHLITHKNSPWLTQIGDRPVSEYLLENGKALTFAFNDVNSTSGYLVPMFYLFAKNEIVPRTYFSELSFLGSHEDTALAIANQEIDVATNNSEALQRFANKYPDRIDELKIIWTSPLIPGDPIAYTDQLPEELKASIREFFYSYDNQPVLKALNWSGFDEATDIDWHPIRKLEIGKQILDIEQNKSIKSAEKEKVIRGLQGRLKELQAASER
ncbi:MAG: phosphonate ABC transporter substrate-binding protein [Cyanobacteria bacterium P01_C01_bin.89]